MKKSQTTNKRAGSRAKAGAKPKRGARSRDKAAAACGGSAQNVRRTTAQDLLQDPRWLAGWRYPPDEAGTSGSNDDTNESAPSSDRGSPDRPAQNNEVPAKAGEHGEESR